MASVYEATKKTNERVNAGNLDALAKKVGGTVRGDKVEYQVSGTKGGRPYKATRYIRPGETANYDAPVASDVYKADYGTDNYRGPVKEITSALLTPQPSIPNLPTPPAPSNLGTQAMTQVSGLASGGASTTPTPPAGPTPAQSLKELISSMQQGPNAEKIYQKTEREVQLQEKQAAVNNFQNQINAITAKANADKLSLVGQGRGVTEAIIGGQQAQIDREAAIQALPISAQLAAAQGDLASAQDHMDTLFKIRLQDAQNKVDYKNKIAELVYNFATAEQKTALEEKRTQDERAFTIQRDNIDFARKLGLEAMANGQSSLASQFMKIDFSAPDGGASQIASLTGQVAPKAKTTGGGSGTTGFKDADTESSVRQDAVALLADVDAGATTIEKAYSKLRTLYSPLEVTDSALQNLLGIGGATTSATTPTDTSNEKAQALEQEIASLRASPSNYSDDYIRSILKNKYGTSLVNNSSIGSIGDQLRDLLFINK